MYIFITGVTGFIGKIALLDILEHITNIDNVYIKRRLFNIYYSNLEFSNKNEVNKIFNKYNELIFNYPKDINFYHQWSNLFKILENKDWELFAEAIIYILNNDKKKSILKLQEILSISNNEKLINKTNKLINQMNNA